MVTLVSCGGGATPAAHTSAGPATATSTPSSSAASATPSSAPASTPGTIATSVHCASSVPAGDNLVIGTVVGDPTIVVRDIQDPAHGRNLCTFDSSVLSPQFVSGSRVAYETGDNQIIVADLAGGATTLLASYSAGFDSGQYAFSPDGKSMTYLDTDGWHLIGPAGNRVLATLPAAPGRGISPNQDDSFLGFSPDGLYI